MTFPEIDPVAIQIGPVAIRWYGIAYVSAVLLGWAYAVALVKRPRLWGGKVPVTAKHIEDLVPALLIGIVVGGRLGHVLLYQPGYYFSHPLEIIAIWKGGMSFHGGLLGTATAIIVFSRLNKIDMWTVGDLVAAAVPIGLFLGRMANFINGEVVGSVSDAPWAMVFPGWGDEPRHPAMLYEALLEGPVLFAALAYLVFRRGILRRPGLTAGWFLAGYAVVRVFCELFKIVDYRLIAPPLPITKGMVYSVPMFAVGLWLILSRRASAAGAKTGAAARAAPRPSAKGSG